MKILVVDNYDSFVFNLVHILFNLGLDDIVVCKNDQIDMGSLHQFDKILLSPGPGIPADAGLMPKLIEHCAESTSILGICLGHQAIAENFGGKLLNMEVPLHGVASPLNIINQDYLFDGISNGISVAHYHSWVVENPIPDVLEVIAVDHQGHVMAIRHKQFDLRGLQFHPESILTQQGIEIIANWIKGKDLMTNTIS